MPATAAIVTALILEHPMCLDCIAERANAARAEVQQRLTTIQGVLELRRRENDRCRACGMIRTVFALERPPG